MEKMDGDLRTLINQHLPLMPGGQMPFDYNEIIAMMLDVAQGMEDLHGCDLIHADLKASNILIYPVPMEGKTGEEEDYPVYFRAKIGDFDTPDDIVGTGFWRAPEVLEALKNGVKPTLSPSADVYSYGMLCYELLTGQVPLDEYAKCDYNVIISGRRPELPAHVNCRMKEMLSACWRAKPQDRPAWTWIREILEKELLIHPPCLSDKFAPGCRIRRMIFNIRRGQRFGESMCIKSTKTIVFP
jgi:serine/threonine protein kinase